MIKVESTMRIMWTHAIFKTSQVSSRAWGGASIQNNKYKNCVYQKGALASQELASCFFFFYLMRNFGNCSFSISTRVLGRVSRHTKQVRFVGSLKQKNECFQMEPYQILFGQRKQSLWIIHNFKCIQSVWMPLLHMLGGCNLPKALF